MFLLIDLVKIETHRILIKETVFHLESSHRLFLTGLLPGEQYLLVLNIISNRTNDSAVILKSKERVISHVGFH